MLDINQLDALIESKKAKLTGWITYKRFCNVLTRAFSKIDPYKFRFEKYSTYDISDFSISGIFCPEKNVKYVIFNFSNFSESVFICEKRWKEFKFLLCQVCIHESIHQAQWNKSDSEDASDYYTLDFRMNDCSVEEEQLYLADKDEIDAYGSDIAMEIKFYYPRKDPYEVLKHLGRHRRIYSYNFYKKTFKSHEWRKIRNRLLKKAYKWLESNNKGKVWNG